MRVQRAERWERYEDVEGADSLSWGRQKPVCASRPSTKDCGEFEVPTQI